MTRMRVVTTYVFRRVQCQRGNRQQVPDERYHLQYWSHLVGASRIVHVSLWHRHHVVSVRRPEVHPEIRLMDL